VVVAAAVGQVAVEVRAAVVVATAAIDAAFRTADRI
jgi:hypothetical protein